MLYQIDPATYQAAYASAKAALARAEANLDPGPAQGRALSGTGEDQGGQPAGLRRCQRGAQAGRGGCRGRQGRGRDRPDQSGLHQGDRAHLRTNRPFVRDQRRAGDRQPGCGAGHDPAARPHLCGCHPVQRRAAAPEAEPGQRPAEKAMAQPGKGQAAAGGRQPLSAAGHAEVLRSHRGSEHRLRHPAGGLSRTRNRRCCPACLSAPSWRKG